MRTPCGATAVFALVQALGLAGPIGGRHADGDADAESVDALARAALVKHDDLAYDESARARKCVWALADIGTRG